MRHLLLVATLGLTGCLATVRTGPSGPPPMEEGPPPPVVHRGGPPILTGTVVDARTHLPMDKVMIDVVPKGGGGKGFLLQTGPDGRFASQPLAPGGYAVRARLSGYDMVNRAVNVVDGEAHVDVELVNIQH